LHFKHQKDSTQHHTKQAQRNFIGGKIKRFLETINKYYFNILKVT